MKINNLLFVFLCSFLMLGNMPLDAQNGGVEIFDPFLQRDLKKRGHIELLRQAEPGVPSPALAKIQDEIEPIYNVIFHGDDQALDELGVRFNTRYPGFATARVTLHELLKAKHVSGIRQVEKGGMMTTNLDQSVRRISADRVHGGEINNIPYTGRDVIIGIIDTGIDFRHPDFRDTIDQNLSRILSIWDVRLDPEGNEERPENFDYGVEYSRDDIQRELRGETEGAIRSDDENGHGTHVAGIAGGNGYTAEGRYTGVAPGAEFVIVSFPDGSFFPAEVVDAMNYIFTKAEELGRPAVVNLSIGGHGGAHDGTGGHELAINYFTNMSGRAVAVASGNSGADEIHYGTSVEPSEEAGFGLHIPNYNPDMATNDDYVFKMLWYESGGNVEVSVTSPNGHEVTAQSGDSVLVMTPDGAVELDTFDNFENQKGARLFGIDIHTGSLLESPLEVVPPASGEWTISVRELSGESDVTFNSWIVTQSMQWPWLEPNTGRRYTVTIPGTAEGAITAGAFISRNQWTDRDGGGPWTFESPTPRIGAMPNFSGGGPTRDGRTKPNITTPGAAIISSKSENASFPRNQLPRQEGYAILLGTSMAAPHAAGVAALIFEANPTLTGREVIEVLQESGKSDNETGGVPNDSWGYGKADAVAMFDYFDATEGIPDDFYLYQNYPNPFNEITRIRFTIPEPTRGKLAVYDILGRKVGVIIEGDLEPRVYFETFNGAGLSSGVYFYRLETSEFTEVKKMILVR